MWHNVNIQPDSSLGVTVVQCRQCYTLIFILDGRSFLLLFRLFGGITGPSLGLLVSVLSLCLPTYSLSTGRQTEKVLPFVVCLVRSCI